MPLFPKNILKVCIIYILGTPIKAIERYFDVDTTKAYQIGIGLIKDNPKDFIEKYDFAAFEKHEKSEVNKLNEEYFAKKAKNIEIAQDYWSKSVPISGTLGEFYLAHGRKIPCKS